MALALGGLAIVAAVAVVAVLALSGLEQAPSAGGAHGMTGGAMSMGNSMASMGGAMGGAKEAKLLAKWGISPRAMAHMEKPMNGAWTPFAPALAPRGWRVLTTTAAPGHPASAALGSQPSAYWQSARIGRRARLPQRITIELASSTLVAGIRYVPRTGLGEIGLFTVSVSSDGSHFGPAVAYGRWQANPTVKQVIWNARRVKAVRLTIESVSPGRARSVAASKLVLIGPRGGTLEPKRGRTTLHAVNASTTNPSVVGQWGPTIGLPLVPVAAALIPGNRLLVWSADENLNYTSASSPYTQTAILDLTTGAISAATVSNTAHNMFCPGVSILPNGDVVVTGGISDSLTSIFNPATNAWSAAPQMNIGRGYQGQTTLSDGQVFTLGGSWSGAVGGKLGEVFSPSGAWRELTGVPANPIYTNDAQGVFRADNHGWFIATSGGKVFQAGPSAQMHWITTTGAGTITNAGARGTAGDEMNGNAVLYDVNKILTVGGAPDYQSSNATNVANVVDISTGTAQVTGTSPMNFARGFANSVALPDGQVFTVGGETFPIPFDDATSVLTPEMWTPSTGQWTEMAPGPEPRNYHSVAVLLPDGTVFSGGGGLCGSCATNHPDGQIFYPPYLFNADGSLAARPTISSAPSSAVTGQTISVTTGGPVQSFVMMRYGEATHTVDNDQRRIPLSITSSSGNTYQLSLPSDPGIALPGPYMLFAINAGGTPSVASTIYVSTPAASAPTDSYGQTVDSTGPAIYWPLADAAGTAGAADLSGDRNLGAFSSSGIAYQSPSPVEGAGGLGVTFSGGQVVSTQPQYAPTTYSEELWFKTTTAGGALATFGNSSTAANSDQDRMIYMTAGGQLDFGVWTGQTAVIQSPGSYNDGKWHFVVAAQGSDGMHLYVDGAQVASGTATTAQAYTGYWQLGIAANSGWPNRTTGRFAGSMSDAAEYLSELTPAQILAQYGAATQSKTSQSITVTSTAPTGVVVGSPSYTPTATASSGLAVAITLDASSSGCGLSGGVVSFTATGACVIDFNQAGNGTYNAAPQVQQSIAIGTAGGFPTGWHKLVIANDSLCLDSAGRTTTAGAAIDQWTCNSQLNQLFQFVPTAGGYGELEVEYSSQYVTVLKNATTQGQADIVQEPLAYPAGQWLPLRQSDGSYEFKNKISGLCLDVYGASSKLGQQLDQWPCKNVTASNQDFKVQ
jgi:galactose oxidase